MRHLESIIRMAEAHARIHLRDNVNDTDVSVSISVMLDSFIQTQKYSVAKIIRKKFSHFITFRDDSKGLLLSIIDRLYRERVQYILYFSLNNKPSLERSTIKQDLSKCHLNYYKKKHTISN